MKKSLGQFNEESFAFFTEAISDRFDFASGTGKPCGASHISSSKTCRIGGSAGYDDVVAAIKADVGSRFDAAHEKVFEDRYAKADNTKKLGAIHRKAIKDLDNDDLDAKEGILISRKKAMQNHLEANQASGVGVKREADLAAMSPEERKQAMVADRIKRGIKNKVVSSRNR
jgi:hypothetical protein